MHSVLTLVLTIASFFFLTACAPPSGFKMISSQDSPPASQSSPNPPPAFKMEPLLWESARKEGVLWSKFVFGMLQGDLHRMIEKVQDMEIFCPKYQQLSDAQKVNALGMLVSGITKYESDFDPLSRYQETTMGEDPITGQPVYSEGLMQMSYQDITGWSFCQFDWKADKDLDPENPKKTILDPYRNLDCGLRILAEQVDKHGKLVIDSGAYWATIKLNGKYQQIEPIAKIVQSLSFCHR